MGSRGPFTSLSYPNLLGNHLLPISQFVGSKVTKIFKLEAGMSAILGQIKNDLEIPYLDDRGLCANKTQLIHDQQSRITSEEKILRSDARVSRLIRSFYFNDFKDFYPEDF